MSKKSVLGKGLDALITNTDTSITKKTVQTPQTGDQSYITVSIHKIAPNPAQPRKQFTHSSIEELAQSIAENGLIQPIVVRAKGKGYEIVAGERRWRAAQKAGVKEVPVIIKEVDDRQSLELALIENLQREDLNPVEEARGYEMLSTTYNLSHEDIAKHIGKNRSTISNSLRLLKLTPRALDALASGRISQGHARALVSLEVSAKINQLLDKIISAGLSVRNTEALVKKMQQSATSTTQQTEPNTEDMNIKFYTDQLKSHFSTNVRISNKNGKGKIEIDYNSLDDFDRILKKLVR